MTVSELIEALQQVDPQKVVYGFDDGLLSEVIGVDELSDRVDINLEITK